MEENRLLTTKEAADYFRIQPNTIEQWRVKGQGPKFVKIGRCIRYRPTDIKDYLDQMLVSSTTQADALTH
jgi:excisionase family DNA binding protein